MLALALTTAALTAAPRERIDHVIELATREMMVFARTDREHVLQQWIPKVSLGKNIDCVVMKLRPHILGDGASFCFDKADRLVSSEAF